MIDGDGMEAHGAGCGCAMGPAKPVNRGALWGRCWIWMAAALVAGLLSCEVGADEAKSPPNIILVFVDDMGWADFSCFGNGAASTPHIDALAEEGICFEQFYVNSPICSPSRVAISTGTYPQRWRITSFLDNRLNNKRRGLVNWLNPKAPMLARSLQGAGYATGHFGKWHMGGQRDVKEAPEISAYGFDAYLTNFEGIGAKLLPEITEEDGTKGRLWKHAQHLGEPATWMERSEITGGFVDAAIPFMEQAKAAGKPFYVNLWPDDVHGPFYPSYERMKKAKGHRDRYMGVLEEMDAQLERLFDHVKEDPQLRENTMILICSDNGPSKGMHWEVPFKGYKTHLYEGGIRSPLVVWAPGIMDEAWRGTRNTSSVFSAIDLVPSILALTGVDGEQGARYDGEDVSGTLLGNEKASRQEPLFFSRPPDRKEFYGFKNLPDLAVRKGKWKLLCDFDGSRPMLYDLLADPGESKNLAEAHPELREELWKSLLGWYRSIPMEAVADGATE